MSNNIIKYICLALLLAACQEDEALLPDLPESTEKFEVTIPLGIAPETGWSYETDYVPMQTRSTEEGEFTPALIDTIFTGLVMKEIKGAWYVDTLQHWVLDKEAFVKKEYDYLLSRGDNIGKIDLMLSPGHYKILVITASKRGVKWNPDLKRGYLINEVSTKMENIPYACTYLKISPHSTKEPCSFLSKEVFAGVRDFTVSKTEDLHSIPQNGDNVLKLTRRVSKYRLALERAKNSSMKFPDTQHYIHLKLKSQNSNSFCEGIDCFGKAYYDPEETKQEIDIGMSTDVDFYLTPDSTEGYQLLTPYNSTDPAQYLFIDPELEEGIPYKISYFHLTGAADGTTYKLDQDPMIFPEKILYPNSITGIALQAKFDDKTQIYTMSLKSDIDPAKIFSPTVEIDFILHDKKGANI